MKELGQMDRKKNVRADYGKKDQYREYDRGMWLWGQRQDDKQTQAWQQLKTQIVDSNGIDLTGADEYYFQVTTFGGIACGFPW